MPEMAPDLELDNVPQSTTTEQTAAIPGGPA
jgi:hypothetical protein